MIIVMTMMMALHTSLVCIEFGHIITMHSLGQGNGAWFKTIFGFQNPAAVQITNGLHGLNINCTISLENTTNCEIGSSLWGSLTFPIYLPPSNVQNQNPSSFSSPKYLFTDDTFLMIQFPPSAPSWWIFHHPDHRSFASFLYIAFGFCCCQTLSHRP